jgi:uncharacterized alkaline shock family protein YloU
MSMSFVVDEPQGSITVTPSALASLVARAAETVEGAHVRRGRRRLDVELGEGSARVRLELTARYGIVLPELARNVQEQVADALATMCRVEVEAVDVSVEEIE